MDLSFILEQAPVAALFVDSSGAISFINHEARQLLGFQPHSFSDYREIIHVEDRHILDGKIAEVQSETGVGIFTCRYSLLSGEAGILKLKVRAHRDRAFILLFEDITDQTTGVARLRHAKEAAERATRTKSAFLANMSHEIRTPIHTIRATMELLASTELDEEQQDYVSQVRFSADVLLSLINDILDFSKIEAGKLRLEHIEFDLHRVLEEAIELVSLQAHQKQLESVIQIMPDVPRYVKGDPARLRQIIINLFNNAVKFTKTGEVVLRVFPGALKDGVMAIRYEVSDTGIGIPTEKLTTLFNPFTQVDSSTTRKFGGTGLGLSICRSLVGMMNGRIGIRSQVKKGSTFWFTIPTPVNQQLEEEKNIESSVLANRRILLVDDNSQSVKSISAYIQNWGGQIDTVGTGPECLDILRSGEYKYDLVLIDFLMPKMDGWQLASEINNDRHINDNKLILMNPTGVSVEAKMKLLHWFNAYITKPIRRHKLIASILEVLGEEVELGHADEVVNSNEGWTASTDYKILVAEDHFVNQQLFKTILEKIGFTVLLANDGREAVDIALKEDAELVFMDIQMPEVNGYEATVELREQAYDKPIIAVTANAFKGEKDRCFEVGMDDYLTKPFDQTDLIAKLRTWLPEKEEVYQLIPEEASVSLEVEDITETNSTEVSMEDNKDIFDYEEAVKTFMGNEEVVLRVLGALVDKLDVQFHNLEDAYEQKNYEALGHEAHGIKGSSWNIKAKLLGDSAFVVEEQCYEQNYENLEQNIETIKAEKERFVLYLKDKGYIQ